MTLFEWQQSSGNGANSVPQEERIVASGIITHLGRDLLLNHIESIVSESVHLGVEDMLALEGIDADNKTNYDVTVIGDVDALDYTADRLSFLTVERRTCLPDAGISAYVAGTEEALRFDSQTAGGLTSAGLPKQPYIDVGSVEDGTIVSPEEAMALARFISRINFSARMRG